METNKTINNETTNLFVTHREDINKAYERAVREALAKHKKAGNSVVVSRNGEIVTLKPDEIEIGWCEVSNTSARENSFSEDVL